MEVQVGSGPKSSYFDRIAAMIVDEIQFVPLNSENVGAVVELIRRNLGAFEDVGSVLASSFRRVDNILKVYSAEGAQYIVALDASGDKIIGGAGLGSLAGLPVSEGVGEIREIVIDEAYRGRGFGTHILRMCLEKAVEFSYSRIYLETTPQMENAQRLFKKFGFRPVTHAPGVKVIPEGETKEKIPCYFLLEDLADALTRGSGKR